jgi:hypothetical protein
VRNFKESEKFSGDCGKGEASVKAPATAIFTPKQKT